jgi:ABC-type sugar transport system permease subunit
VGPDQSTNVLVFALFTAFWSENNYGFAAALSVVLFALLLVLSLVQYRLDGRVHYQ